MSSDGPLAGRLERLRSNTSWLVAAGVGAAVFVGEYVVVALLFLVGPSSIDVDSRVDALISYGHVLYNAHNVPTYTTVQNATIAGSARTNALHGATDSAVSPLVFLALPVVALLVAGVFVGRRRSLDPDQSVLREGVDAAGELALGYFAVGILGTFAFVRTVTFTDPAGSATWAPYRPYAVVLLLLYSILFGWIGSVAVMAWRRRQS